MDSQSVSSFVAGHADELGWAMLLAFLAIVAGVVLSHSLRKRFGSAPRLALLLRHAHRALAVLFIITALRLVLVEAPLRDQEWNDFFTHALDLLFLAALGWFLSELIFALEDFLILHYVKGRDHTNVLVRKVDTQIRLISHLAVVAVIVIVLLLMLMTFPEVRIIGGSLLASAGIVSVVAGLAAKTSLSNLFAGVQIALSDSVRVGDIIQIGDQSGVVDDITLTYVVIDLWNEHRLTVPSEFFISNQFQNWTRNGSDISALFEIEVDWTVPVDGIHDAVKQAVIDSGLWDSRSFGFKIFAITNGLITLRIVISTDSAANMFLLEAVVNRAVVDFITSQPAGQGLPRSRMEGVGVVPLQVLPLDPAAKTPESDEEHDPGSIAETIADARRSNQVIDTGGQTRVPADRSASPSTSLLAKPETSEPATPAASSPSPGTGSGAMSGTARDNLRGDAPSRPADAPSSPASAPLAAPNETSVQAPTDEPANPTDEPKPST